MTRIYDPPEPHACDLVANGEWVPKDLRRGAVEVCDDCGTVWVYDPISWERRYRRMYIWPFDRKVRAIIRAHKAGGRT